PAPDNHFSARPDGAVPQSCTGSISNIRWRPTIRSGIIPTAGVDGAIVAQTTPDDHGAAGPDCGVTFSRGGSIGRVGCGPKVASGVVSRTGVGSPRETFPNASSPDDHFAARPDRCVKPSLPRGVDRAGCRPAVGRWIIARTSIDAVLHGASPDDHFSPCPD